MFVFLFTQQEVAAEHYDVVLCRKALQHWMMYVDDRRNECQHERQAVMHDYLRQLRTAWTAWRKVRMIRT